MSSAAPTETRGALPADTSEAERLRLLERRILWYFGWQRFLAKTVVVNGHHNVNLVARLDETLATELGVEKRSFGKLRAPLKTPAVVMRTWANETDILAALHAAKVQGIPRCLVAFERKSVHTFAPGRTLSGTSPVGTPVGEDRVGAIADVMGRTAVVRADQLPPLPEDWPADKDSNGFLRRLAEHAHREVYLPHRQDYGTLFDALEVPHDAMERFLARAGELTPRPFGLLHTDLHRDNIVVLPDSSLFILDWELATYGDPLHDLATHLVRMRYTPDEDSRMRELWEGEMKRRHLSAMTAGMETDLQVYIDFEHAQSVYADIVRAATRLGQWPVRPRLDESVSMVRQALLNAQEPIGLERVPEPDEIEVALRDWHAQRHRRRWNRLTSRVRARTA